MNMLKLLAMLSLALADPAYAAGLGCDRALAHAEKLVCANPDLRRLDAELNSAYQSLRGTAAGNASLVGEQRRWIADERNACLDVACLAKAYQGRIDRLRERTNQTIDTCAVSESALLGHWRALKGADFEEFAISREGERRTFVSWLHGKPEYAGAWKVNGCMLELIHPDNPSLNFNFRITSVRNGILIMENADDNKLASYRKSR